MFLSCSLGHLLDSDLTVTLLPSRYWSIFLNIAFQSSFSTGKSSLFTGRSKINVSLLVEFVLPVTNWTLRTSPFSSLYVFSILAIGHLFRVVKSSRTKTISPTSKFCLVWFHFCQVWSVANTSFLHRAQNLVDKCWTHQHCFLQHMSSFWKVPGGGMTTLVFELSSCIGLNGIILLIWPMDSQVIGQELIIPSISTNNVRRDSLLRLSPWFLSIAERMLLADRIYRSHTPPMLLAMGGLRFQLIHSPPNSIKKSLILFSSISPNAFFSSMLAPTKLVPLSLRIMLTFPRLLIKHLSAWMKLPVVKLLVTSMCTALLDKHVNMTPYLFWIFRPSLARNGPNMSTPQ